MKSGMLSERVAQNPTLAVRDGMNCRVPGGEREGECWNLIDTASVACS